VVVEDCTPVFIPSSWSQQQKGKARVGVALALDRTRIPSCHVGELVLVASPHIISIKRLKRIDAQDPHVHPRITAKRRSHTPRVVGNEALEGQRELSKSAVTSICVLLWGPSAIKVYKQHRITHDLACEHLRKEAAFLNAQWSIVGMVFICCWRVIEFA
jgi:hypothetical protein